MNLAELEAQTLASRFDRNQLAVYADALQSSSDLGDQQRGELIALDLYAAPTAESDQRRRELLAMWLGDLAPYVRCEWGFLDFSLDATLPDPHLLAKLLSSPAAGWLRGLEIYGAPPFIRDCCSLLALAPRRRLVALAITQTNTAGVPTITGHAATRLIEATPALTTLAARGFSIFGAFPHPTIRRMRVAGWNAVGSLAGQGAPLAALEQLDLAFHRDFTLAAYPRASNIHLERMLRGVPALRRLDLSSNERSGYFYAQPMDLFGFLRELAIKRRLTHLRVPAIHTAVDLAALQSSLDKMPELVELEITRLAPNNLLPGDPAPRAPRPAPVNPGPPAPFTLALFTPATIVLPTASDWFVRTHGRGRDHVAIEVPDHPRRLTVDLLDAVKHLETCHRRLSADTLSAWDQLWALLERLAWDSNPAPNINNPPDIRETAGAPIRATISAALLARCCADMTEPRWRAVHAAITTRSLAEDATVRLQRSWSY